MNVPSTITRRALITAGGVTIMGAGAVVLAACTTGGGSTGSSGSGGSSGGSGPTIAAGITIGKLSEIPVGGTASATVDKNPVLLAQPTAGKVVCFSAICTHQGCTVAPAARDFECPCHGSTFATDGSVIRGPATLPLAPIAVKVSGDAVVTG